MAKIRLDKYLAQSGYGTRTEVKALLKTGKISVNGQCEKRPELKVDPKIDQVSSGDLKIAYEEFVWGMLYKPAGCVTATKDKQAQTVMEYIPAEFAGRREIFPVGRLDVDTEGLLLFTDDGVTAHNLLSPTHHVDKMYETILDREVSEDMLQQLRSGVDIGDEENTLPCQISYTEEQDLKHVYITIHEGRFHQIKRMFHAVGAEVVYLKRLSMGPIRLDPSLEKGAFRKLSQEEINLLNEHHTGKH